jgi:uncharacterized protein (TIGR03086 family)
MQHADMTNSTATEQHHDIPTPGDLPDPRPPFGLALDRAAATLAAIGADDLTRPTPAEAYTVDQLARHLIAVVDRIAAVARGEDPFSVPQEIDPVTDGDYRAALDRSRVVQEQVWADDAVLGRELTLPFAVLPGAVALSIYISEITVHTWDLATAIGAEVDWDDDIVAMAHQTITMGLPAEPRGDEVGIPFDPVVPTAEDAPIIERLVAWTGRDPGWRP